MTLATRRRSAASPATECGHPPASAPMIGRHIPVTAAAVFALVAAGHALGTLIVYQFDHTPSSGVSFFPADGVTLAALLLCSRRYWPVIAAATFISEYTSHFALHEPALTGFGLALSNTIGPTVGAWLVLRLVGRTPRLDDGRDLTALILGGVLVGPFVDALTGPPFARLTSAASPYLETAARWWTGDALGALIVGLAVLAWAEPRDRSRPRAGRAAEAAGCAAVAIAVASAVFFVFTESLAYLVLLPLGWAAMRFGMRGATAATIAITAIAEWATVTGHGQFAATASSEVRSALWLLQLFLGVAAVAALVVASEVARTHRAEAARRISELAEQQAHQATVSAAAAERNRLARELHDSVSQALFAAAMHARSAEKQLIRSSLDAPKLAGDLSALRELTAAALAEMRALIFELRPDALLAEGIVAGLDRQGAAVQARTGLPVTVTGPVERLPLAPPVEEQLYRVAHEALNNAVKHARASSLTIAVADLGDEVEVLVRDDGVGFDPTHAHPGHLGLHSMRERAGTAGGTVEISGRIGTGTTVRCRFPSTA